VSETARKFNKKYLKIINYTKNWTFDDGGVIKFLHINESVKRQRCIKIGGVVTGSKHFVTLIVLEKIKKKALELLSYLIPIV